MLWRKEFQKNGIGFDEIVLIGNNLGELTNPAFIPNVFELIRIVKKIQNDPERKIAHERVTNAFLRMMNEQDTMTLRKKTKKLRNNSMSKIMIILNAS